jgi:HPt (histidine-containing phosphotransfer) domain-containing protein
MRPNTEAVLDPDVLQVLRDLGGEDDPGLFAEIIDLFLEDSARLMEELDAAYRNDDALQFERTAHTLKSSSANLGALAFAETCAQLEQCGRGGDLAYIESTMETIRDAYTGVVRALESLRD